MLAAIAFTGISRAASYHIEFKPVLNADELAGKRFTVVDFGGEKLYLWNLRYLTERDMEKVEVYRSAARAKTLMAGFKFAGDGRKRLYRFTKKFAKRRVAILADGQLITAPVVWVPVFMGDKVVVTWPGTEKQLWDLAEKVNRQNDGIVTFYIDETVKYNEAAADDWAKFYETFNKYFEAKRKSQAYTMANVDSEAIGG
jgi:preprotein translocase subunit SecD